MTKYRIEFRTYNIGDLRSGLASGFAHNFLVLVEIRPDGRVRPIAELHGHSVDRKTGQVISFDWSGQGRLTSISAIEEGGTHFYRDSLRRPSFTLFDGSRADAMARFDAARKTGEWINRQNFDYSPLGQNSNSMARTLARAMGYDVTSQPIDKHTGQHFSAPGSGIDLRDGRTGVPRKRGRATLGVGTAIAFAAAALSSGCVSMAFDQRDVSGNLFGDVMHKQAGHVESSLEALRESIGHHIAQDKSLAAIDRLLVQNGATCRITERELVCKRSSSRSFYTMGFLQEKLTWQFEVYAEPARRKEIQLKVCLTYFGISDPGGRNEMVDEPTTVCGVARVL